MLKKSSTLKTVRNPNQPKRKTVLAKNQLPKETEILQNVEIQRTKLASYERPKLRPFRVSAFAYFPKRFGFYFLAHITPSSAAVFKLWFCGILLRSKTIKPRLKNCPVQRSGTVLQRLVN